jgi:hypothetical protein
MDEDRDWAEETEERLLTMALPLAPRLGWTSRLVAAALITGCETVPPGAERGPHGTMAYDVLIEASAPGARIEANGADIGEAPVHLKIFGDTDGTFHDFGSPYYVVKALPLTTNQFAQTRVFQTGHMLGPEDHIPPRIYFDMNQNPPPYPPAGYGYPGYGPSAYYGPSFYYGPPYYGPDFRFYVGPRFHRRRW